MPKQITEKGKRKKEKMMVNIDMMRYISHKNISMKKIIEKKENNGNSKRKFRNKKRLHIHTGPKQALIEKKDHHSFSKQSKFNTLNK